MSKEHPILMNGAMVRAVLDGRKQQTRRIVKPQPIGNHRGQFNFSTFTDDEGIETYWQNYPLWGPVRSPYGKPGDRLWVRESARVKAARGGLREIDIEYQADGLAATVKYPSRLAPAPIGKLLSNGTYREASRILLEITGVRVERLQDISDEDALAEGVSPDMDIRWQSGDDTPRGMFGELWESINGAGSWDANPWVWVIKFKVVTA